MKKCILINTACYILLIFCLSCKNNFDENRAKQIVNLSQSDIELYCDFNQMIIEDLPMIRKTMKPLSSGDTILLSTNSYYLYQIDSLKYSKIIDELKKRKIFTGNIETSPNGMIAFRLKEMSKINWDNNNATYIHDIVFNYNNNEYIYSNMNILVDSLINNNIRYIYFTSTTGH